VRVVLLPHDMELHAIDEGVIVDRARVCSASTKSLKVGLSRQREILVCDRRERQQIDVVDLDHHGTAPVHASDLDLWSRPEPVGDGDAPVSHSISEISAELHAAIVSRNADAERALWTPRLVVLARRTRWRRERIAGNRYGLDARSDTAMAALREGPGGYDAVEKSSSDELATIVAASAVR